MTEKPKLKPEEIELHPDAWERFGEFVKRIARAGPQHRKAPAKPAASRISRKRNNAKPG